MNCAASSCTPRNPVAMVELGNPLTCRLFFQKIRTGTADIHVVKYSNEIII